MLRSFAEIEKRVLELPRKTVAVPAAANTCILEAAIEAHRRNLADFILIDSKSRLKKTLETLECDETILSSFEHIEEEDCVEAARLGVRLVREGKADLLGKGRLQTFELMKAVLDKEDGLRTEDSLLSDIMVIELPEQKEPRLIGMSDPALCVLPSADELIRVTRNSVAVLHKLGITKPRVAILAALEVVKESMPATAQAADVARRINEGAVADCVADGPLSMDTACSARSAAIKKRSDSPVAGKADLLIVPNIEAGNILAKTIAVLTRAEYGHLVVGSKVPVVMSSRADSSESKFNSILLGLLAASA